MNYFVLNWPINGEFIISYERLGELLNTNSLIREVKMRTLKKVSPEEIDQYFIIDRQRRAELYINNIEKYTNHSNPQISELAKRLIKFVEMRKCFKYKYITEEMCISKDYQNFIVSDGGIEAVRDIYRMGYYDDFDYFDEFANALLEKSANAGSLRPEAILTLRRIEILEYFNKPENMVEFEKR